MATLAAAAHSLLRRQSGIADPNKDENIGSAQGGPSSISALVSTLVVNLVIFVVMVGIFMLLRRTQKRMYAPKKYVTTVPEYKRRAVESVPADGLLGWLTGSGKADDRTLLRTSGLDGYFFLRYLRTMRTIIFTGCCLTVPILIPINITGGGTEGGLNKLSFSNSTDKNRLWGHVLVGYVFFSYVLYTIYRELIFYINLRQAYMFSPLYAPRLSARTVLITSIPEEYMSEAALRRVFDNVKRVWLNFDVEELEELVKERDETILKLEAAEVKLIKNVDKVRRKKLGTDANTPEAAHNDDGESGSVAAKWVERKARPTHRTKFLVGEKVDTIDWCRGKLAELNPKVEAEQAAYRSGEKGAVLNSAFIEFTSQNTAQVGVQTLAHHMPLHMSPRYIGVTPNEVVWSNMKLGWLPRLVKIAGTTAFIVALVIFWSIPVAIVGTISQVDYLTEKVPFLEFINDIPPVILGLITGLLPVVMLAVLMALLPIILRLCAKIAGAPSLSQIELRTQNSYFAFQVFQVFLVTTLSSAVSSAVTDIINDPGSTPSLLADSIPKASNFYIAFMILQGLALSASALLQIAGLVLMKLLGLLLDNTPRKMFKRWSTLSGVGWGTVFPLYTNMVVIALTYSIIAPLVCVFATIGLSLLYIAYRYNFLFVYHNDVDTKGLVYPRALYQTLTGVYLAQIVLIGLFGLRKAIGPLVLQVIFLIFTILFHLSLSSSVAPLLQFLPKSLEDVEDRLYNSGELGATASNSSSDPAAGIIPGSLAKGSGGAPLPAQLQKVGFLAKFLNPGKHESYMELRKLIPVSDGPVIAYTPEQEREAFHHPAISSQPGVVWIPRDPAGVSAQEVAHTRAVVGCSDEGAVVNEKGKVVRTSEESVPPDWEPEVLY